jgi:hypothetical protein
MSNVNSFSPPGSTVALSGVWSVWLRFVELVGSALHQGLGVGGRGACLGTTSSRTAQDCQYLQHRWGARWRVAGGQPTSCRQHPPLDPNCAFSAGQGEQGKKTSEALHETNSGGKNHARRTNPPPQTPLQVVPNGLPVANSERIRTVSGTAGTCRGGCDHRFHADRSG